MPEAPLIMTCLLHEEMDNGRARDLRRKIQADYPYMGIGLHSVDSDDARQHARQADLLLVLLDRGGRLPVFDAAWWQELRAAGEPWLVFIGNGSEPHAAPPPYAHLLAVPWDGSSIQKLKPNIGFQLGMKGGGVYVAFATEDGIELAKQISTALAARHYEVYFDLERPFFIPSGQLHRALDERMGKVAAVILVDTPGAAGSGSVFTEVQLALGRLLLVKLLVCCSAGQAANVTNRLGVQARPEELAHAEAGARLSEERLTAFLDSFERDLEFDLKRRASLRERAGKMFADVGYSFQPKDVSRRTYESTRRAPPPPAGAKVHSNASGRSPGESAALTAYAQHLNQDGFGASYSHRYYLHQDILLDSVVERRACDCLRPAACDLLHFSDIPGRTELRT